MTLYRTFRHCIERHKPVAVAGVVAGPDGLGDKMLVFRDSSVEGELRPAELMEQVTADAARLLRQEQPKTLDYTISDASYQVFVDVFPVPAQLVIVGAAHAAEPLSRLGRMLGYRVVVTDARAAFAQAERFPDADVVLKGWPQDVLPSLEFNESTYVVLLSHDPKFDQPTLEHVLPTDVPYIGAIGSRKTQRERFQRLREQGFRAEQLARIHGPVGLDLGGTSIEETALAIMAEITAVRRGRPGGFLRDRA